jgi:hypothetical protein
MPCVRDWKAFVYISYLDEAGTDGHSPYVVFGAVVVTAEAFGRMEQIHDTAIQQLFSRDEIEEKFEEFHASEFFHGTGAFKEIEEKKRFDAIRLLLWTMVSEKLPYIYGAVDRKKLGSSLFASAKALDVAFRLCILGIEDWARLQHPQDTFAVIQIDFKDQYLLILDDHPTNVDVKR